MKKIGIAIVLCSMLFVNNSIAQEKPLPFLFKESIKRGAEQLKQQMSESYPGHTEEFRWETDWIPLRTIETSYETFGSPKVIEITQDENKTRELYAYNNQHRETEVVEQQFIDGDWVNLSRHSLSYNNQGMVTQFLDEEWTGTEWQTKGGMQLIYEMEDDQLVVLTSKFWNEETSEWENSMRETYTYSGSGTNFTSAVMEMWDGEWKLTMKYEYSWDSDKMLESMSYTYENGEWLLMSKTVYEFSDEKDVMTSYSYIGPDEWMPSSRSTTLYDDHENVTLETTEMYMEDWMVLFAGKFLLTYSGDNLTQRITQTYSMFPPATQGTTSGLFYVNALKEVYSNFASLSTEVAQLPVLEMSVFPNPAGKEALVRLSHAKAGPVTLTVYAMTGQEIIKETFTCNGSDVNHQLNLSEVLPGSYLLILRDNLGIEIGKTRLIKTRE